MVLHRFLTLCSIYYMLLIVGMFCVYLSPYYATLAVVNIVLRYCNFSSEVF
jgi:hypothetical protein